MKKITVKSINKLLSVQFVSLIAGLFISILFLRSVISLIRNIINNIIGNGGYYVPPYGTTYGPNHYLAVIAGLLLILGLTKCRKTWELIIAAIAITIIGCGYGIYLLAIHNMIL
jgi:xanthine/uracil/vitamin C permease (AzgA family)